MYMFFYNFFFQLAFFDMAWAPLQILRKYFVLTSETIPNYFCFQGGEPCRGSATQRAHHGR